MADIEADKRWMERRRAVAHAQELLREALAQRWEVRGRIASLLVVDPTYSIFVCGDVQPDLQAYVLTAEERLDFPH